MQRYFLPPEGFGPDRVHITGDDAHHLIRVMRAQPGDEIICCDGFGRTVLARLTDIEKADVTGVIVEELPASGEPSVEVWVAQSLPKGDKLETVLQKCTELGAAKFLPFLSERTVVQYDAKKEVKRLDRWRKIVKEAAEQSHRSVVPEVLAPLSWKSLLKLIPETELAILCYEKESGLQLRTLLREAGDLRQSLQQKAKSGTDLTPEQKAEPKPEQAASEPNPVATQKTSPSGIKPRILVIIGPEGGITEREAEEAEQVGARSTGLGPRILRTETAGMVATACILYEYGEMGG
ncbi:RsmE family RNA methyltransferase [Gorillibacterium timonense]|uniref:RsmE family RNA methyltransferase n=1 Tax=Gorillibacterium timonense TaxID=1689269 RepID=UPI00071CE13D|nr:RsmE family RNA methyltransferase [Gorillibacterium timonense]